MSRIGSWFGGKKKDEGGGSDSGRADQLEQRANDAVKRKDYGAAEALCSECFEVQGQAGNAPGQARALRAKAEVLVRAADLIRAREVYAEAAEIFRSENLRVELAAVERDSADAAVSCGDFEVAGRLYRSSLSEFEAQVDRRGSAAALLRLGILEYSAGRMQTANDLFLRSLELFRAAEMPYEEAVCHICLAAISAVGSETAESLLHIEQGLSQLDASSPQAAALVPVRSLASALAALNNGPALLLVLHYALPIIYDICQKRLTTPSAPALAMEPPILLGSRQLFSMDTRVLAANPTPTGSSPIFLSALNTAKVAYWTNQCEVGNTLLGIALAEARSRFDLRAAATALVAAVNATLWRQTYWHARDYCKQLIGAARDLRDNALCADALYYEALMAWRQAELEVARRNLDEAIAIYKPFGAARKAAACLALYGRVLFEEGDFEQGPGFLMQALDFARGLADDALACDALTHMAYLKSRTDPTSARSMAREALQLAPADSYTIPYTYCALGDIERRTGNAVPARECYLKALKAAFANADRLACAQALEGCGLLAAGKGNEPLSVNWLGKAAAIRGELLCPIETLLLKEFDLAIVPMRLELGEEVFSQNWATGARTPLPQIVESVTIEFASGPG